MGRRRPCECGTMATTAARLDLAAASCCGLRHDVNEDAHSALNGAAPVYVVADGVGGGAMASRASRELVRRVHRVLDNRRIEDASVRAALLIADHEVARSIASETDQLGAATVALCACAGADLANWLVAWVGDCRAYRVAADTDREAGAVDARRHVPASGGDAAARRLARRSRPHGRQRCREPFPISRRSSWATTRC